MSGGEPQALGLEEVVFERVVTRAEVAVLGVGQPAVGEGRVLGVVVRAQGQRPCVAQVQHPLQIQVIELEVHVFAGTFALLADVIQQHIGLPVAQMRVAIIAAASAQRNASFAHVWRQWSDVVDDRAGGLRAEHNLAGSFEHFNTFEAIDRWMVVTGVVAVG